MVVRPCGKVHAEAIARMLTESSAVVPFISSSLGHNVSNSLQYSSVVSAALRELLSKGW